MTGNPPATSKTTLAEQVPPILRPLIALNLASGLLLIMPLLLPDRNTPAFGLLAIVLLLPYLMVWWRLLRTPGTKEGPGLAVGIGALFTVLAALGCAVGVEQRDYLHLAYFVGLGLAHALLAGLGFAAFWQGASRKPVWRVALRSFVDPVVYYGIVFFLALGALGHHFLAR